MGNELDNRMFLLVSQALNLHGVCLLLISPELCHALSSGVKHNLGSDFFHLRLLQIARPWCPVSPVFEGWHSRDSLFHTIKWAEMQGWDHLRASPGFGEFWFIPPLLVITYLPPTSFIWKIFSGLSGVGLAWIQAR